MAETPRTALKKRIRSATPPDAPKNINFGDDSGIVIEGPVFSPTAKPDQKKKKKEGEIMTLHVENTRSKPTDGTTNNSKMATPDISKQQHGGDNEAKPDGAGIKADTGPRILLQARRTRGVSWPDSAEGEDPTKLPDDQVTVPIPKLPARRGRLKKRTLSVDPVSTSKDIFAMLMDIRNEMDIQKEDNQTIKSEMVEDISCKLEKLKTDVCHDLNVVQSNVHGQSEILKGLDKVHKLQAERVSNLEEKQYELENEITNQLCILRKSWGKLMKS